MNNQQARIEAHLERLRANHEDRRTVDLVSQTQLAGEGYLLSALDADLND